MNGLLTLFAGLATASTGYFVYVRLKTLLTYFQQDEYDASRLWETIVRVRLFDIRASVLVFVAAGTNFILGGSTFAIFIIAFGLLLIGFVEERHEFKKGLVLTERAKRILLLACVIAAPFTILLGYRYPIALPVLFQALPLSIVLSNKFLSPLQKKINDKFTDLAELKLARMNPTRIGITGSFGKTTVKHIFAEILAGSGPVLYSPGSINTVLGMTRHLRRRLQWAHRFFVAEMGAYGIGSIDRLCDFVKPNFGIVTSVGSAHIERFGSTDVVARAKSELVKYVCSNDGIVVINSQVMEFKAFQDLKNTYPDQIMVVGHTETDDVRILSSDYSHGYWKISLNIRANQETVDLMLPLAGEHNVMNAALAVSMCWAIDPASIKDIGVLTKGVQQIPHRLQLRENKGQHLVLDDSFNSNETGFKNAVAVLSKLAKEREGRSILITPGIAELGVEHDAAHHRVGEYTKLLCDVVIVVNPDRIPSFTDALRTSSVDVIEVPTLADARSSLAKIVNESDVVLFENDLPDLLEEKRLL